jgi:hypothetical protein
LTLRDTPVEGALSETAVDRRTHLIRVRDDASLVVDALRSMAAAAAAAGNTATIVDLSEATGVNGAFARQLSRAHERLLWRGGQLIVVFDPSSLEPMFDSLGPHRVPDVVPTLDDALAAANVGPAGYAAARDTSFKLATAPSPGPPAGDAVVDDPGSGAPRPTTGNGEGVEAPWNGASTPLPAFAWRRHQDVPASWTFELRGGATAPGVARAVIGRVLSGRLDEAAYASALLLVSEAVTNSVLHGGAGDAGTVELTVTVARQVARVEIVDPVGGFEPPPYPAQEPAAPHGLRLIHSLARTWGVDSPPGGRLWFELARGAA